MVKEELQTMLYQSEKNELNGFSEILAGGIAGLISGGIIGAFITVINSPIKNDIVMTGALLGVSARFVVIQIVKIRA